MGQLWDKLAHLGGSGLAGIPISIDHEQRRIDHGAGVLERTGRQVEPFAIVTAAERQEASALLGTVGTEGDQPSARRK